MRKSTVLDLFNALKAPGGYSYENLELQKQPATLYTRRKNDGMAKCEVGPYLLRVEERFPEMSVEEFTGVVDTIFKALGDNVPPFFKQRVKIQCLTQSNSMPPLVLLACRISNVIDMVDPFGREPSRFGLRFRFVPYDPMQDDDEDDDDEDDDDEDDVESNTAHTAAENQNATEPCQSAEGPQTTDPSSQAEESADNFVTVRYEVYSKDPRQIWLDVASEQMLYSEDDDDQRETMRKNILDCAKFAMHNCKAFLEQFETPIDQ